jgi:hydrogenase maturation protease
MSHSRVIVIAYGNPLRGDDGLAWHAADELKSKFASSDVEILKRHQLVPELAEDISHANLVIFMDAAVEKTANAPSAELRILEIGQQETTWANGSPFHHQFSPASLLALTLKLYKARPRAFVAELLGKDFDPGERFSPAVQHAMPEFVGRIEKLILELTA